jgi:ABC-type dipeptide/oligopeptide/nickel transport system ATPase component
MTVELSVIDKKPRKMVQYILRKVERNNSMSILITGATGSGKSYSALSLLEEIDSTFNIDRVVFTTEDLLKLVTSGSVPRGGAILYDEVGIGGNSRRFMSQTNQALNYLFQSVRSYNNPVICLTTPHAGFVDSAVRKLMHAHFESLGVDSRLKKCRVKPLLQQVSQRDGTLYRKYLRVRTSDGRLLPLKRMGFSLPSLALRTAYEAKKRAYQDVLYRQLLSTVRTDSPDEDAGPKAVLSPRQDDLISCFRDGLNVTASAERMGTSIGNVSQMKKSLEKKGFLFKPVKKGVQTAYYEVIEPSGGFV